MRNLLSQQKKLMTKKLQTPKILKRNCPNLLSSVRPKKTVKKVEYLLETADQSFSNIARKDVEGAHDVCVAHEQPHHRVIIRHLPLRFLLNLSSSPYPLNSSLVKFPKSKV